MVAKNGKKRLVQKRKYLNQRQAWLEIAEAYMGLDDCTCATIRGRCAIGLCNAVSLLSRDSQGITISMCAIMMKKIKAYGKRKKLHDGSYFWPLTADGDSQRVRFCQRMARLCMKKRKN